MRDIQVRAGYYEWVLWVDDKPVYSFGDITDLTSDRPLKLLCEDLFDSMCEDVKDTLWNGKNEDYEIINSFTPEEDKKCLQAMKQAFGYYY